MADDKREKMPWYLLRTDTGDYSLSASLVLWSFFASLLMLAADYVLTALKLPRPPSEILISTILLPTVANYFGRRWTDSRAETKTAEAKTKTAQAETKTAQAETKTAEAETKTAQAETKTAEAENEER